MAFPGVPMVFAGDEVGVEGADGDQARAPFPWDEGRWDKTLLAMHQELIALRRASHGLRHGGLRWVHAAEDSLTFLRESSQERVLVHLGRAPHAPVTLDATRLGVTAGAELLFGATALRVIDGRVSLPGDGPAAHLWRLDR
jgi:alpha-glucosidase